MDVINYILSKKLKKYVDDSVGNVPDEKITEAVNTYLKENPVAPGATSEQAEQIQDNTNKITELKGDLDEQEENVFKELLANEYDYTTSENAYNSEINNDGRIVSSSSGTSVSGWNYLKPNKSYVICDFANHSGVYAIYDKNKIFTSKIYGGADPKVPRIISPSTDERYMRFDFQNVTDISGTSSALVCEEEAFDGTYHPYGDIIKKYKAKVSDWKDDGTYVKTEDAFNPPFTEDVLWDDMTANIDSSNILCTWTRIVNDDGSVMNRLSNPSSVQYPGFGIVLPNTFVANHEYFIAVSLELKTADWMNTLDSKETKGITARLNYTSNTTLSAASMIDSMVTLGETTNITAKLKISENQLAKYPSAKQLRIETIPIPIGGTYECILHNICFIDLTETGLTLEQAQQNFTKYGYNHGKESRKTYQFTTEKSLESETSNYATHSNTANILTAKYDIDLWGDSLVAQKYGDYIAEELGRTVYSHGYGGKTSSYIRKAFLSSADTSRTIIINVGRNDDVKSADLTIQNIHQMVDMIPHNRYLICCPPTGNYDGEGSDCGENSKYALKYDRLRQRLSKEFGLHFFDSWGSSVQSYDMGNVTLQGSFIKPSVGESAVINVSDVSFLVNYNQNDLALFGESFMKKIVVCISRDNVDIYTLNDYDIDQNSLTITLESSKTGWQIGDTVQSVIDSGGNSAEIKVRVMQYADYYCWLTERTQSTFRSDGIHMSERGRKCLAHCISRQIALLGI